MPPDFVLRVQPLERRGMRFLNKLVAIAVFSKRLHAPVLPTCTTRPTEAQKIPDLVARKNDSLDCYMNRGVMLSKR
jgi:hypothetical protein